MRIVRFLVGGFLIVAAALVVPFYYNSDTAIYECSGKVTKASVNTSGPIKLFIKVRQYKWWAFWNTLNGVLRWEDAAGSIPTTPDDPSPARWFLTGSGKWT